MVFQVLTNQKGESSVALPNPFFLLMFFIISLCLDNLTKVIDEESGGQIGGQIGNLLPWKFY